MPRFSLKDVFVGSVLIQVGIFGGLAVLAQLPSHDTVLHLAVITSAGATIGAGLGTPFHRRAVGAVIVGGLVLAFMVFALSQPP
jgi:hypothetical protein